MAVYNVANATELTTALGRLVGGDSIVMASGNYGVLRLSNKDYASNVTIKAAANADVVFTGMNVQGVKNLTLSGFEVARPLVAGEPDYVQIAAIRSSSNVRVDDIHVHGSLDDDPWNDGRGLQIHSSTDVTVTGSKFEQLNQAVSIFRSYNIVVKENEFTGVRMDGITVAATEGIVIDGNRMSHWKPMPDDHSDFIQFWNTNETKGTINATIKNNVLIQQNPNDSIGVQGIWISDPFQYGYKNLLIQNNLVYSNNQYNGISVFGGTDVQILGNTVLSDPTDNKQLWIRLADDTNVTVAGNVTDNILLTNMTKLAMGPNLNFAINPAGRAGIADLVSPGGIADLAVPGYGYKAPVAMPMSPVSAAIGGGLGALLTGRVGASLEQGSAAVSLVPLDTVETVAHADRLPAFEQIFAAGPDLFEDASAFAPPPAPMFDFRMPDVHCFVALP